ncbi:MAG: hypothetical protein ABSD59_12755 [Terracidiphilus sp.]
MNIREGTKRMRRLGQAMFIAPILAWVLYNLYEIQPTFTHSGFSGLEYHFSLRILAIMIVCACPGAILWAAGWVVEGFAKDAK